MVFLSWFSAGSPAPVDQPETTRGGYECAPYTILETTESYQVRSYPASRWATVEMVVAGTTGASTGEGEGRALQQAVGMGNQSQSQAFRKLFRYITGNNEGEQKVSMTCPVSTLVTPEAGQDARKGEMGFYVPTELQDSAPAPHDDVTIVIRPAMTAFVRQFGGFAKDETWEEQRLLLKKDLESRPDYEEIDTESYYRQGHTVSSPVRPNVWIF